jgi:hypothetical protein
MDIFSVLLLSRQVFSPKGGHGTKLNIENMFITAWKKLAL